VVLQSRAVLPPDLPRPQNSAHALVDRFPESDYQFFTR